MPQLQGDTALLQPKTRDVQEAAKQIEQLPTLNANPLKEYVSGGPLSYLQDYFRALAPYIDDITSDFGLEIYDRMLKDPQVTSSFESVRMAVLASGANFTSPIQDEKDPDFALAEEIKQFVERNLKSRLTQPFQQVCYDLLEGMAYGHKVAELVYDYKPDDLLGLSEPKGTQTIIPAGNDNSGIASQNIKDPDVGKTFLKSIKVKPQRATAFIVDAYYNVVALLGLLPGAGGLSSLMQGVIGLPTTGSNPKDSPILPNLLPREKFAVFTFRPKDGDPRGTSILRPAYTAWWEKMQFGGSHLAYMSVFGSPTIIGMTPEDSVAYPVSDSFANPVVDPVTGQQAYLTPEQIFATALAGLKSNSYMVVPGGSKIEVLQPQGNGEAFEKAFSYKDEQISKGIQFQTLSTNEGKHQSRAASQTHENVKDMVIDFAKETLTNCINRDIIYNLVRYNWGDDKARRLAPSVSFTGGATHDFAQDANAIAALQTSGYLHISQYQGIDSRLQLPERDLEAQMQDMTDQKQAQADAQAQSLEIAKAKLNSPAPGGIQSGGNSPAAIKPVQDSGKGQA